MKRLILYITIQILAICSIYAQQSSFDIADKKYVAGIAAYNAKKYSNAIKLFAECDSINKTSNRQMPYFSCNASQWVASCYHKLGDDATARSINSAYKFEPIDQRLTIKSDSLGYLASQAMRDEDYSLASQYAKEAMEIESKILGPDHYYVANSEYTSTSSDIIQYKNEDVIPHLEHYVRIVSQIDKEYPDLIYVYQQLILHYDLALLFDKGEELYNKLNNDYKNDSITFEKFRPQFSSLFNSISEQKLKDNDLASAFDYAQRSATFSLTDNDGYNTNHKFSLYTLIRVLEKQSNYKKAIQYAKELCELTKVIGTKREYNMNLESLAILYYNSGDYPNSYDTFESLLSQLDITKDDEFATAIKSLDAMGWNAFNVGDYVTAEHTQERAVNLFVQNGHEESDSCIYAKRSLGYTYFAQKNYKKSLTTFKNALRSAQRVKGERSYLYALLLSDFSKAYEQVTHNYKKGIRLSKNAICIMDRDSLCDKQAYITTIEHLASSYSFLHKMDSAYVYYTKGFELRKKQGWKNSAIDLLNVMTHCDSEQEILFWEKKWFSAFEEEVSKSMSFFHRNQRESYWRGNETFICYPLLTSINYPSDYTLSVAYNSLLKYKGLLLSSERSLDNFIKENGSASLVNDYNNFLNNNLLLTEEQIYSEERKFINRAQEIGFHPDFLESGWKEIQTHLGANDVAVEFFLREIDNKLAPFAACFTGRSESPKVIMLIDITKERLNSHKELYNAIWQPIIEELYINEGANIYFSPDGALSQLGIEFISTPDGTLMSEKYNMFRVSSTRVLCDKQRKDTLNSAVLYGGLRYDTDLAQMEKAASTYTTSTTRGGDDIEKFLTSSTGDKRFGLSYLYETLSEVDSIESILDKAHANVTKYTDNMGNEESFKAMSGKSPNLLHIATHGFYFNKTIEEIESQSRNVQDMMRPAMLDKKKGNVIDYSMERTGLVFSGAANRFNGNIPNNIDDGLLTAKEIAQLDLSNTDLVVLSACDTGGGDITNDGVAGLQRGFKNAGVNSILMSLWKVDDEATRMLMVEFYRNLMSGHSKMESLRNAQRYVRTYTQDGEHIFSDPKYWASFILLDGLD